MMASFNEAVNPELLALARKSRGLTQSALAKASGVHQSLITRYEGGHREMPEADLAVIARLLDYPESFFRRRVNGIIAPTNDGIWHRARASLPVKVLHSAYAHASIRWLEVATLAEGYDLGDAVLPMLPHDEYPDPERVAATVRAAWGLPPGPVHNITRLLERHGCVIFVHPFGHRKLDAFSARVAGQPAFIHINDTLPPDRWRYTLAHELGHLVMHSDLSRVPDNAERDAHRFAAAFLMPSQDIRPMLHNLSIPALAALKLEWKVAMSALVKRADDLHTILPAQTKALYMQLGKAGYKMREPEHIDPPREYPGKAWEMVKYYLTILGHRRSELHELLHINERDFNCYYRDLADDAVAVASESGEWDIPAAVS